MYFILKDISYNNQDRFEVLDFFEAFEELKKKYYNITSSEGIYGFSSSHVSAEFTRYVFVGYNGFFEKEYVSIYPVPPKEVRVCTQWLIKQKLDYLIKQ